MDDASGAIPHYPHHPTRFSVSDGSTYLPPRMLTRNEQRRLERTVTAYERRGLLPTSRQRLDRFFQLPIPL